MAEITRNSNQARTSAPGKAPRRDGDHDLGNPWANRDEDHPPAPKGGEENRRQVKQRNQVRNRQELETPASEHGSTVAGVEPQRDGDFGLGDPWSEGSIGQKVPPKDVERHDRQEKEQTRKDQEREVKEALRLDTGLFRLPAPILNFLSWTFLAAASVLGLLLIGQGAAAIGHIRALPTPLDWVAGVAGGGFALVLVVLIVRLGWALMRLRRSPAVNLAGLQALNERRQWQLLAILHAEQAQLQLQEYLEEFDSEKAHSHLSDDERARLANARQYLLDNPQILSAPEWLEAFHDRFQSILDGIAARRVRVHAVKVGIGTAASRLPLLDQAIVLSTCMAMLRELLLLYGLRPNTFQAALLLGHSVMATYLSGALQDVTDGLSESGPLPDIMQDITDGVEGVEAVGTGIVGHLAGAATPFVGKLFERASEGAINGILVWRLGSSAIKQIQPIRSAQ